MLMRKTGYAAISGQAWADKNAALPRQFLPDKPGAVTRNLRLDDRDAWLP
jgi:hypothetical protein